MHIKIVGALNTVLSAVVGLGDKDSATLVLGGLCHDLGHGRFGHTAERMLQEIISNHPTHEARTVLILEQSGLGKLFAELGVSWQEVASIVNEEGDLGALQRVTDSAAWTMHDTLMCTPSSSLDEALHYARSVIKSVVGVKHGCLVVNHTGPIQEVANRRMKLFRDWFMSTIAEQSHMALSVVMRQLLSRKWLNVDAVYNVRHGHEHDLVLSILERAQSKGGAFGRWVTDLLMLPTNLQLPGDGWNVHSLAHHDAMAFVENDVKEQLRPFTVVARAANLPARRKIYTVYVDGNSEPIAVSPAEEILSNLDNLTCVMVPNFSPTPWHS